ncbi:hypothetical protein ROZALSC1DRAFT_26117, partial [Rozella allomycis CSF55]
FVKTEQNRADGLSRRLYTDSGVVDIDEDIDVLVGLFKVDINSDEVVISHVHFDLDTVDENWKLLCNYILTLQFPENLTQDKIKQIKKLSEKFFINNGYLWKRSKEINVPPRRVIFGNDLKECLLAEMHEGVIGGHR